MLDASISPETGHFSVHAHFYSPLFLPPGACEGGHTCDKGLSFPKGFNSGCVWFACGEREREESALVPCLEEKNCKAVLFNQEDSGMQSKCSEATAKLVALLASFHGH